MMKGMPKEARMVIATSIHQSTQASTTMLWPKRGTAMSTMQFTMVASAIGMVPANMALHSSAPDWQSTPCDIHGSFCTYVSAKSAMHITASSQGYTRRVEA